MFCLLYLDLAKKYVKKRIHVMFIMKDSFLQDKFGK